MVKLLFFARLREVLGTGSESVELPAGCDTLAKLRAYLVARGGRWADALADHRALRMAVNQEMAKGDTMIKAGDEIAFFPPVTGG